ncbi:MAG: sulfide-dependent adenosine diphosphate thiazole synthase [Elusimicrobiota bacterium]
MARTFEKISEKSVTRAIVEEFAKQFSDYVESDVMIIGAGPSGLMCAKKLALKNYRVLVVERNNYLGGGFWLGGYLMNKITVRSPAEKILEELQIPYSKREDGLIVADGPHACSGLIKAACDAGIKVANMTSFDDLVYRQGRAAGAVINWTPVEALPRQITCVDPIAMESRALVDATGHDAAVLSVYMKRKREELPGFGAMWVDESEEAIIEHTGLFAPGLYACGMSVSTAYGLARMGPTFGSMLESGKKLANIIDGDLSSEK